jgi:hypothetical protein
MLESFKNFFRSFWRTHVVDLDPWDSPEIYIPSTSETPSITASPLIISLPTIEQFKASKGYIEIIQEEAYLIAEKDGFKLDPKVYWEQAEKNNKNCCECCSEI